MMLVEFTVVGLTDPYPNTKAHLDVIPRLGETVQMRGLSQHQTIVRTVVWYPVVDDEGENVDEPFVYVVLGPPRPGWM